MSQLISSLEVQLQIEEEPENCEEISAGGDLVESDFEEPDADTDAAVAKESA
jgi:hypothetical protein